VQIVTYKGIINICDKQFLVLKEKGYVSWFLSLADKHWPLFPHQLQSPELKQMAFQSGYKIQNM
jgi:hypothetical protein